MNIIKQSFSVLNYMCHQIRWNIVMMIAIVGVFIFAVAYLTLGRMQSYQPHVSLDRQILRERLFISVRQDSLSQLVNSRGLDYSEPGLFGRKASMGIPSDKNLMNELDSLQHYFPDDIELEDGFLLCQTQKVEGVRFVSVPVVWLLRIRLMNDSISNKVEK